MRTLFFFGTLRHTPLLEVVLGRAASDIDLDAARLPGHRVSAVADAPFPMIERLEGASAEGQVVRGLTAQDIARLDFYEGSFAYDLTAVTLADGQAAEVYMPRPGHWTADGPWSLDGWVAQWGALSVLAAQEVMSYFGEKSREEVAGMFPTIRARAASRLRGPRSRHSADTFRGRIEVGARSRAYAKFYVLDDLQMRHERFDGTMSDSLERAILIKPDAAFVLPYDPVRDRVLVIEQVRVGPIVRDDARCWHMEPIAGGIDAGETPGEAARREALEEAGLQIGRLEPIAEVYPSSGSSSEFFYLFLGLADLPDDVTGSGGLETEHEDIRSHLWSFEELMRRVDGFDIANAALLTSAFYLARHRDRLRSEGAGDTPDVT